MVTAEPVIVVRDVVVSYNGRRALNGINLEVFRGETLALLGGSGSGKSPLLRQIIGLERPDSGQVLVNRVDLTNSTPLELKSAAFWKATPMERRTVLNS